MILTHNGVSYTISTTNDGRIATEASQSKPGECYISAEGRIVMVGHFDGPFLTSGTRNRMQAEEREK